MTETVFPSPTAGDVIFTYSKNRNSVFSPIVQAIVDPRAKSAGMRFSHVAVAVNSGVAIEAMPAKPSDEAAVGVWSGEKLENGVRLVPLGDVFASANDLVALRRPLSTDHAPKDFDITSAYYAAILGSAYSLDQLKRSAELAVGAMAVRLGKYVNPGSEAKNIGALMIDDNLRREISKSLPNFKFAFENTKFFCSDLVTGVLKNEGLLAAEEPTAGITPIGLFKLLQSNGWIDVTDTDYSPVSQENYLANKRTAALLDYRHALVLHRFSKHGLGFSETTRYIDASFASLNEFCDDVIERLNRK
jgi:hypothetical protein